MRRLASENMLDSLFQEKPNISKEMMAVNERRIEAIKERMATSGGVFIDDSRAREFIQKTEMHHQEQLKQAALKEE